MQRQKAAPGKTSRSRRHDRDLGGDLMPDDAVIKVAAVSKEILNQEPAVVESPEDMSACLDYPKQIGVRPRFGTGSQKRSALSIDE